EEFYEHARRIRGLVRMLPPALEFQLRIHIDGFDFLQERTVLSNEIAFVDFAFLARLRQRHDGVWEKILGALAEQEKGSYRDIVVARIRHDQPLLAHEREEHFAR